VDGFRFDLRRSSGVMSQPVMPIPCTVDIESDPALAGTSSLPRPGCGGLYEWQLHRDSEGVERKFRDDVRAFSWGRGSVGRFADRLLGSPAIYGHKEREVSKV